MTTPAEADPVYTERVVDAHCHVASTRYIPQGFFDGVAANVAAKLEASGVKRTPHALIDSFLKHHQDHEADGLVRDMTAGGIDMAVLLLPDFTHVFRSELTIAEMYGEHHRLLQRHPGRFVVFAGADPHWGQDGIDLFERGVREYGFRGLKLYPPCGYSPSDKRLYPYFEICRRERLPVLLHVGPTSPTLSFQFADPWHVDQAARDFPEVDFILAHGAVHFVEPCASLCAYRPNVYLDTSAFLGISQPGGWQRSLATLFLSRINHKIIFGTDWPVFRSDGGHRAVMNTFKGAQGPLAGISPEQRRWIMHRNIERLLGRAKQSRAAHA